jgi:spore coat polysaccharide biosynthesis predicted glycosyltransferase SpsG
MRFVFRADGGNIYSIAMGHVYRTMRFAAGLDQAIPEAEMLFWKRDYKPGIKKAEEKYQTLVMDKNQSWEMEMDLGGRFLNKEDILVVDIRKYPPEYIDRLKAHVRLLICFDDLGRTDIRPDILINPDINTIRSSAENPCETKLTGPEYLILDPGLQAFRKPHELSVVRKVLFSFGGADPMDITNSLLFCLNNRWKDVALDVIAGGGVSSDRMDAMRKHVRNRNAEGYDISLHRDVPGLAEYFQKCDLAVVAGGTTCFEALYSGIPTVIAASIYYEQDIAETLERAGAATAAGFVDRDTPEEILAAIERAMDHPAELIRRSRKGMELIDGRGMKRIVKIVREKVS